MKKKIIKTAVITCICTIACIFSLLISILVSPMLYFAYAIGQDMVLESITGVSYAIDEIPIKRGYAFVYYDDNHIELVRNIPDGEEEFITGNRIEQYAYNRDYIGMKDRYGHGETRYVCVDMDRAEVVKVSSSQKEIEDFIKKRYKPNHIEWNGI